MHATPAQDAERTADGEPAQSVRRWLIDVITAAAVGDCGACQPAVPCPEHTAGALLNAYLKDQLFVIPATDAETVQGQAQALPPSPKPGPASHVRYPPIDLDILDDLTLRRLGRWHTDCAAAIGVEAAARARRAAYRLAASAGGDDRWNPQPWHGARITAGPYSGYKGFILGPCADGCRTDGGDRYRFAGIAGGKILTCVPRERLVPVPTYRGRGNRIL